MKKYLSAIGSILFLLSAIGWVIFLSHVRNPDSFSIEKLVMDQHSELGNSPCPPELLHQPFSYVGHGTQMIAFEGADGQTVLKFFLQKKISGDKKYPLKSLKSWIPHLREKKSQEKALRKEKDLHSAFHCYFTAFEKLQEEVGLIAIHLSATEGQYSFCQLKDFQGKDWEIDLDRASFVIQHKAIPLRQIVPTLQTKEEKERFFQEMDALLEKRAKKGFRDLGQGRIFDANYGFMGDKPILFDAGRIGYSEEVAKDPEPEIEKMEHRLRLRFNFLVSQ